MGPKKRAKEKNNKPLSFVSENEEALFNPNCRSVILLNVIKNKCAIYQEAEVDLSDESGNVKNLRDFPEKYASEFLSDRERLVLIRVDKLDEGETRFIPLLNDKDSISEQFLAQLSSSKTLRPTSSRRIRSGYRRARTPIGRKDAAKPTASDATSTRNVKQKNNLKSNATRSKGKIK